MYQFIALILSAFISMNSCVTIGPLTNGNYHIVSGAENIIVSENKYDSLSEESIMTYENYKELLPITKCIQYEDTYITNTLIHDVSINAYYNDVRIYNNNYNAMITITNWNIKEGEKLLTTLFPGISLSELQLRYCYEDFDWDNYCKTHNIKFVHEN